MDTRLMNDTQHRRLYRGVDLRASTMPIGIRDRDAVTGLALAGQTG